MKAEPTAAKGRKSIKRVAKTKMCLSLSLMQKIKNHGKKKELPTADQSAAKGQAGDQPQPGEDDGAVSDTGLEPPPVA